MSTRRPSPAAKAPAQQLAARAKAARQRRQRRLLIQVGLVAAAATVVLFLVARAGGGSSARASGAPFAVGQPGPGEQAPPIELPSTAGGSFDLAEQRGKTVLLYFHEGLGCQPCWDQMDDIEKDFAPFDALGIDQFVAIAANPLDKLRQKAADEDLKTAVLADPSLSLGETYNANQYGMMGTGTYGHSFIVVGPDGKIRWRADYGGSPNYTMYLPPSALLGDLRAGLGAPATPGS